MTTKIDANCVDFQIYPHWTDLGKTFTLGWLKFTALTIADVTDPSKYNTSDDSQELPRVGNWGQSSYGLTFNSPGMRIDIYSPTSEVTIKGGSGISRALEMLVFDPNNTEIARDAVPGNSGLDTRILSGNNISSILIRNFHVESLLSSICIAPVDVGKMFDNAVEEAKSTNDKLSDLLEDPKAQEIIDKLREELENFYKTGNVGGTGGGTSSGGGFGISIMWPDWGCLLANLALLAGVSVLLSIVATELGVATIGQLAQKDFVAALVTRLGIEAAVAEQIFLGLGAGIGIGMAISMCG